MADKFDVNIDVEPSRLVPLIFPGQCAFLRTSAKELISAGDAQYQTLPTLNGRMVWERNAPPAEESKSVEQSADHYRKYLYVATCRQLSGR
jgi:hypothetical protein